MNLRQLETASLGDLIREQQRIADELVLLDRGVMFRVLRRQHDLLDDLIDARIHPVPRITAAEAMAEYRAHLRIEERTR